MGVDPSSQFHGDRRIGFLEKLENRSYEFCVTDFAGESDWLEGGV